MKRILTVTTIWLLFSCQDKDVQLPVANKTIVANVYNHTPVYFFFKRQGNDTLVDVNRKNTISTTNWLFNIDKRLPLRLVISEIQLLQEKKQIGIHENDKVENFFAYADSIQKKMAFLSFTKIRYRTQKPNFGKVILFTKNAEIYMDGLLVKKDNLNKMLESTKSDKPIRYQICFDKNMSFGTFIKCNVFLQTFQFNVINSITTYYIF